MPRAALIVIFAWMLSSPAAAVWEQDEQSPPPEEMEKIIQEILELRGEAAALLESLSPEQREEVERRWEELRASPPEAPAEPVLRPETVLEGEPEQQVERDEPVPGPTESTAAPASTAEARPQLDLEDDPASPSELASEPDPARECDSLAPLDTNGDGVISAGDRAWRYLRLRADLGANSVSQGALESLYDLDIREIDVNLRFYKLADGASGDISIADRIRFDLIGKRRSDRRSLALYIQASRLSRGGELRLVDASGGLLAGDQPLVPGVALQSTDGRLLPLLCP
jgi:hypothetical protein